MIELHLRIVGFATIALALLHVPFGVHLKWREDAAKLTAVNRQVFHVHTFFLCLTLVMMGVLAGFFAPLLLERTPLARLVLLGHLVFWGTRLVFQWAVYSWEHWRGKRMETVVHVVFTGVWVYLTAVYGAAWFRTH